MSRLRTARWIWFVLAVVAAAGAVATALTVMGDRVVQVSQRSQELRGGIEAWDVEVAERFTVLVPIFEVFWTDTLITMSLTAVSAAAAIVAVVLRRLGGPHHERLWHFYVVVAAGALWLALDESFSLHEALAINLEQAFGRPGLVRAADDAIFAAYGLVAIAFVWRFREIVLAEGAARRLVCAGGVLACILIANDLFGLAGEEYVELLQAAVLLLAIAILARTHLPRAGAFTPAADDDPPAPREPEVLTSGRA